MRSILMLLVAIFGVNAFALGPGPAKPGRFSCDLSSENGETDAVMVVDINHAMTDHPDDWAASYTVYGKTTRDIKVPTVYAWVEEIYENEATYGIDSVQGLYPWFGYEDLGELTSGYFTINYGVIPAALTFTVFYGGNDIEVPLTGCEIEYVEPPQASEPTPVATEPAFVCYQGDGDDRYDLIYADGDMAIVHTNDRDETELIYYDSADYFPESETLTGGRYILNFGGTGHDVDLFDVDASLHKLAGREKVLLSNIMECEFANTRDTDEWVQERMNRFN